MKRLYIFLATLSIIGILIISLACSSTTSTTGTTGTSSPTSGKATVAAAATQTQAAASDKNYTVRIGFPSLVKDSVAPGGPDLWALKQGLFEKEFGGDGITVQYTSFLGAAPAINEALGADSLDLAVIADIGALIGKAGGLKTSLVAMADPNGATWELLVPSASSIQTVEDLKGKKVATVKGTLPHFYLLEALKAHGLQSSDIELLNMTGPDAEQALRSNQIDATVSGSWKSQKLLQEGFRAIDSTKETPIGRGTMVIVATDTFIAAHPGFFPRFYEVRQQAADWANANRDAAIDLLAQADGGIDRSFEEPLYSTPFNYDQSLSTDVLTRIKTGESFLTELGLTKQPVDVDIWINQTVAYKTP